LIKDASRYGRGRVVAATIRGRVGRAHEESRGSLRERETGKILAFFFVFFGNDDEGEAKKNNIAKKLMRRGKRKRRV
jgi:hypothetical protein